MFARRNDAGRVGVWVVAVAAAAGLLVLLLQSDAHAGQPTAAELAAVLAERAPLSGEERLDAADAVLRSEQRRRMRSLTSTLLATGWKLAQGASPSKAAKNAVKVARQVVRLRERSAAEDQALDLLESAIATDMATPLLLERHAKLLERERGERLERRIQGAESAFEAGELRLAGLRAKRWLALDPDSVRAAELLELSARRGEPEPEQHAPPVRDWEAGLALALLAEKYERAAEFERDEPDARLARAVAEHLSGEHERARARLERLGAENGSVGKLARRWSDSPEERIESEFERARRRYGTRRALGWLGGERLSASGFELSRDSARAWRKSLSVSNLTSTPLRLYRRWEVEDPGMTEAAQGYLRLAPEGRHAAEAAAWLARVGAPIDPRHRAWDDGRFVLPRARTAYRSLAPEPLLLTRAVLESETISHGAALQAALGDAPALRLVPRSLAPDALPLAARHARALLADLSHALQQQSVDPHGASRRELLLGVRRMELALDAGLEVVAEPWSPRGVAALGSIQQLLLTDGAEVPGSVQLAREDGRLALDRGFGRAQFDCPSDTLCIDRERMLSGSLFGRVETDGEVMLGARTSFSRASLAIEFSRSGPQASLVIPIGYWLQIDRWVPLQAHLAVSLGGISVDPSFETYAAAAD